MKNVMNVDQMEKVIKKIMIYNNQESLIFDDIKKTLNNLDFFYNTNNKNSIDEKKQQLIEKTSIITDIHNDNVMLFNKNVEKYINLRINVEKKLDL